MGKREVITGELIALYKEGTELLIEFRNEKEKTFSFAYQSWYTKSIKAVESLAVDRLAEFRGYYEIDPKRKSLSYGTYVIQDYLKNVVPTGFHYTNFDARKQVANAFLNQLSILSAVMGRIDSVLSNIEGELYAELQDNELATCSQLLKISPRAAGALAGVVIEGHLQKVAIAHSIKIAKKAPTISDLNEAFKNASLIDTATWRKISYLGDIRNLCSHKKDIEPTKEQIAELIQGAEWLAKNVF